MITLQLLPHIYTIWQLPSNAETPPIPTDGFHCVIRTADELSGVCPADAVPPHATVDDGWRCIRFEGPFDLTLTGIMVQVAQPLALAQVPIFTLATYNTDYILVPQRLLDCAINALRQANIIIHEG